MKKAYLILLVALSLNIQAQTVKITAASDLRYAFDELISIYKSTKPNTNIDVVYGSSGNACTQLLNGAPFDIYFSADIKYPQKLKEAGLTLTEPKLYAIGRIVLWSKTIDVSKGLAVLAENPTIKIATANPLHAPYGQRSVEALKYYDLYNKVEKQLIFGENISQAAQFCLSANADAGLLALSLVLSPAMTGQGKYFLIDNKSHSPLEQAYVILKQAKGNTEVKNFIEFIGSKAGREIFEKYGFNLPK